MKTTFLGTFSIISNVFIAYDYYTYDSRISVLDISIYTAKINESINSQKFITHISFLSVLINLKMPNCIEIYVFVTDIFPAVLFSVNYSSSETLVKLFTIFIFKLMKGMRTQ